MADILRRIVETGKQLTDAPDLYIEITAYWIISSTIGKYVVVPYYPRPPENPYRPNLWVVISGLPGIMRKSTVIDGLGRNVVKQAWRRYYEETNPRATPQQIDEMISRMFIETGSYEGIVKHIAEHQRDYDSFFLVSTEWGGVLHLMKAREYMTGFATLLSKLWAGEEHLPRLVHEVRYIRPGLYVTALLGMQEPWLYLDNIVFRQGLMRRVLLIYQEPEDKTRWLPPLDLSRSQRFEELRDIAAEIAQRMVAYESAHPVEARFSADAHRMINEYAKRVEEELRTETAGNWTLYYQNMWDHLVKLAVLHSISRHDEPVETPAGYIIHVESMDVRAALNVIQRHIPKARQAITLTGVPIKAKEINISQPAEETIKAIIESAGSRCISTSELLRSSKMLKKEVKEIIINLMEKGEVVVYAWRRKNRGRTGIYFCSSKHAQEFESRAHSAQKLSPNALENLW